MAQYKLNDWSFEFCNGKYVHGKAKLEQKIISISRIHTLYEINEEAIRDTILHEIAHALDYKNRGKSNHDAQWKKIAYAIGCVPSAKGYPQSKSPFTRKEMCRWLGVCPKCGIIYYRHYRKRVACSKCCTIYNGGNFSQKYLLRYKANPNYIPL